MLSQETARCTQNREFSWLRFNERVLMEALDDRVPPFERLKFVRIFTGNLDEFFMIRVGSLAALSLLDEQSVDDKTGMTAREQLTAIHEAVRPLIALRDGAFSALEALLRAHGVVRPSFSELEAGERAFLGEYFASYVAPALSPRIVDERRPFPHLEGGALCVAAMLESRAGRLFGLIPVSRTLPRAVYLPGEGVRYLLMEDIVLENAERVFGGCRAACKTVLSVTRSADISADDEAFELEEDVRLRVKRLTGKRARLMPVRLQTRGAPEGEIQRYLLTKLRLAPEQVYRCEAPIDMGYVGAIEAKLPGAALHALAYPVHHPAWPRGAAEGEGMMRRIARRDILLHHPYESMEPFLCLIREAALDPAVDSIQITLYRIDKQSRLAESLIMAAENGRKVTVMMELRARFDEQNNVEWAERLEDAGCRVLYGVEGFKAHAKICLITRREPGRIQHITQVGTGNYNEKTAAQYSDFSLMTANPAIGLDAAEFFRNLAEARLGGEYRYLLVAPEGFKRAILSLIRAETQKAAAGRPCGILIKINSLTDREVIDALAAASRAGVKVELIVRGICCLLPGIAGETANIRVVSVVGRFLEHARAYVFGAGEDARVYIASADLMTRNTRRRVEIACPILDMRLKRRLADILRVQLSDSEKARRMLPDGTYARVPAGEAGSIDSQRVFLQEAEATRKAAPESMWLKRLAKQLRTIAGA